MSRARDLATFVSNADGDIKFDTDTLFIDSSANRVGIQTSTPSSELEIAGSTDGGDVRITFSNNDNGGTNRTGQVFFDPDENTVGFRNGGVNRLHVDSSGNVGVGTSSPSVKLHSQVNTFTDADKIAFKGYNNQAVGVYANFQNTTTGTGFADGFRVGIDDSENAQLMNGENTAMMFSTNATEAMRIDSSGNVLIGTTSSNPSGVGQDGIALKSNGSVDFSSGTQPVVDINRTTDGQLVWLRSAYNIEGTISISGTTTSYNGGHLSRWSQLTDGSEDTSIVKGTVMTNLDQMAVWHHEAVSAQDAVYQDIIIPAVEEVLDEDGNVITEAQPERTEQKLVTEAIEAKDAYTEENEQLNCMAVSSVEGDPNVAGVFVNWDHDDDEFNDMNVAMTGDMVIRIAQGTTVARGDLLMSAGDGTAKPQGDDIVRSKTIAKVTSTNVSHTYDDGSYLVPCVLMAC